MPIASAGSGGKRRDIVGLSICLEGEQFGKVFEPEPFFTFFLMLQESKVQINNESKNQLFFLINKAKDKCGKYSNKVFANDSTSVGIGYKPWNTI